MVIAQMLKYLDDDEPVRFLIAETESAFTLVTALYFARLFGVEHKIDISPLFETRKALEHGPQIIAEALDTEAYRAYVEGGWPALGASGEPTAGCRRYGRIRSSGRRSC